MLENRHTITQLRPRCRKYQSWASWAGRLVGGVHVLLLQGTGNTTTSITSTNPSSSSSPNLQAPSSGQISSALPTQTQLSRPSVGSPPSMQIAMPFTTSNRSWIILSVQESLPEVKIKHIPINAQTDNSAFYKYLKVHYHKHQGMLAL